jgi:CheY-like chemotaxis protein
MTSGTSATAHLVLIEDNPSDVYLMKLALQESGLAFELTSFENGAEALLTLCPEAGAANEFFIPDLILLDLNTPGIGGFEVLARIRGNARLADVPVAIITSSDSPDDKHRAAMMGATTYIQKPTELEAFFKHVSGAVKQLLADARPRSS